MSSNVKMHSELVCLKKFLHYDMKKLEKNCKLQTLLFYVMKKSKEYQSLLQIPIKNLK